MREEVRLSQITLPAAAAAVAAAAATPGARDAAAAAVDVCSARHADAV